MGTVKAHWQRVYRTKDPTTVSWYQPSPETSMTMIRSTGVAADAPLIDVGGGASTLVDTLLQSGYTDVSVLDVAGEALAHARRRLGDAAATVTWLEADVTAFVPERRYRLWHDRAVFHFLTEAAAVGRYLEVLGTALLPAGHFVLATFGSEGPKRCSGLDVHRYSIDELAGLLGGAFDLCSHEREDHTTPSGNRQQFLYSWWQAKT